MAWVQTDGNLIDRTGQWMRARGVEGTIGMSNVIYRVPTRADGAALAAQGSASNGVL